MRQTVLFIKFLSFFLPASQEDMYSLPTDIIEMEFDPIIFENMSYTNLSMDEKVLSAPCTPSIQGLSSLGLMVTYIIVSVLGVVGNSVVIYVVYYMEKGRTTTDIYLMHLALADLLFALTLPFWAVYVYSEWIFGTFLCKLLSGLQEASFYSGVFSLACISVDRYLAIVKATQVLPHRRHLMVLVCVMVWLGSALLSLPIVFQRKAMQLEDLGGQMICHENLTVESGDLWRVGARVLRHTLGFFLPLGIMIVCYGYTTATLFRSRNGQKHKAMRVILAVVLAFVLCWLPYNVGLLLDTLMRGQSLGGETCQLWNRVEFALYVTQVMAFMHCALNPVLYAFVGQRFRHHLLVVLKKHGVLRKKTKIAWKKGSVNSSGGFRSRNISVTV